MAANPVTCFSDKWEFFPCYIDNKPFSVRFDTAIEKLDDETKNKFPHILELAIKVRDVRENGLPTHAELERINKIEDKFSIGNYDIRFIGAITGGDSVRFVFCCGSDVKDSPKSIVHDLLGSGFIKPKHDYKFLANNNFKYFYNTLAPNPYERSWIMNRHVCTNLEKGGDDFKTPREIDFFIDFKSEEFIESVAEKLTAQGFSEDSRNKAESGNYSLQLTLKGIPTHDWINGVTSDIISLLEGTDGYFDGWGCHIHKPCD